MSNETTGTSLTELVAYEVVEQSIKDYLIDLPVISPLCQYRNLTGRGSRTSSFSLWVKDSGADISEGTGLSNNELETTQVSVTIAQVGVLRELTDFVASTAVLSEQELFAKIRDDGAKLVVEMLEDDLAALFASATGATVGTSGADLSVANLIEVIAKAKTLKVRGNLVGVLDDQAAYDAMAAIASVTGSGYNGQVDQSVLEARTDGYLGSFMRFPMWVSNLTDTANGSADVCSGAFIDAASNEAHCPFSFCDLGAPKVFQETSSAMPSYKISTVYSYGVACTHPTAAIQLVTDA